MVCTASLLRCDFAACCGRNAHEPLWTGSTLCARMLQYLAAGTGDHFNFDHGVICLVFRVRTPEREAVHMRTQKGIIRKEIS